MNEIPLHSSQFIKNIVGMTGFDSVIHSLASPLSGMATVPVTHLLHTIIANRNFLGARFQRVQSAVQGFAFAPAFA